MFPRKTISHKSFTMATIDALVNKAHITSLAQTRSFPNSNKPSSPSSQPTKFSDSKRSQTPINITMKSLLDKYPYHTTNLSKNLSSIVGYKKRGLCVWCQVMFQESKRTREVVD